MHIFLFSYFQMKVLTLFWCTGAILAECHSCHHQSLADSDNSIRAQHVSGKLSGAGQVYLSAAVSGRPRIHWNVS